MRKHLIGLAVVGLALAGCTGGESEEEPTRTINTKLSESTANPPPVRTTTGTASSTETSAAGGIPSPDASQQAALLAALGAVDPALADEGVISDARNTCDDILQGKDEATVASNAAKRFTGSDVPALSADQITAVVQAIRGTFCS